MLAAVEVNHKLGFKRNEIDNKGSDWLLPAKLEAAKSPVTQLTPKPALEIGLFAAKATGEFCRQRVAQYDDGQRYPSPIPKLCRERILHPSPARGEGKFGVLHERELFVLISQQRLQRVDQLQRRLRRECVRQHIAQSVFDGV